METASAAVEGRGQKVRAMLKARLGDEIYSSWFKSLEFESFDGRIVKVSVPVKFVRNWIQEALRRPFACLFAHRVRDG